MAARRRHDEEEEEHSNHERWLLTYADMITLLMVLFIVLFAIGQTDLAKFEQLKKGMGDKAGSPPLAGGSGALSGSIPTVGMPPVVGEQAIAALHVAQQRQQVVRAERESLTTAQATIQSALDGRGLGNDVRFRMETRGLIITIVTDKVLYDVGSAVLRPEGRSILDAMEPSLASLGHAVAVEGHTDDQPVIGGPYPSNWELSTARSTAVLHYLIDALHFPADRLSAAGYGSEHPLVSNTTAENQMLNRRVEVVVLSRTDLTEGAPS